MPDRGRGALDIAYHRALHAEADRYNGLVYGAMLWGFTEFFDTLDVPHLVREAVALGLLNADLCLGLRMHLAPRRFVSGAILSRRSVHQGGSLSIAFTRVFMCCRFDALVVQRPNVDTISLVDDSGQFASGRALA